MSFTVRLETGGRTASWRPSGPMRQIGTLVTRLPDGIDHGPSGAIREHRSGESRDQGRRVASSNVPLGVAFRVSSFGLHGDRADGLDSATEPELMPSRLHTRLLPY